MDFVVIEDLRLLVFRQFVAVEGQRLCNGREMREGEEGTAIEPEGFIGNVGGLLMLSAEVLGKKLFDLEY